MNTMYPTIYTMLKQGIELPVYAHEGDAGLDLCANEGVTLFPGEWRMVGSGVTMAIPQGFVGLVVPRSGMGCKGLVLKHTIGVINSGYRGEIKLPLYNNNQIYKWLASKENDDEPKVIGVQLNVGGAINVRKGDRVAQLLIVPVARAFPAQVGSLDETERQEGGFGSTDRRPRP